MFRTLRRLVVPALILAVVLGSTAVAFAATAREKGFEDGRKFGREAGEAKGLADGKSAGDAAGFAKGMEDERTGQPPAGGEPPAPPEPPTPPATAAASIVAPDLETAEHLGQSALTRYPDLMPRASETATTAVATPADSTQDGLDYSTGFALGLAAGFAETYPAARAKGYQAAYPAGYARGRAEYRRLARHEDGTPIGAEEQVQLAVQAMLANHYQEAIERFDIAICTPGVAPFLPRALYYKAKAWYEWAKPAEALKVLVKLLSEFATSDFADDGYFLAGASYERTPAAGLSGFFGQRCYAQARDAYHTLTVKYPESPILVDAYLRLGYTCEKTHKKDAAIAAYKTVVERFPQTPQADQARERLKRLQR